MNLLAALGDGSTETQCSRAGCRNAAVWALLWHNPRIHTTARHKTWLTCSEHREFLEQFLHSRDFPVEVTAFTATNTVADAVERHE